MSVEVLVVPWPRYSDSGSLASWDVHVMEPKRAHRNLVWSTRMGRFVESWAAMNLRRSAPKAHQQAVLFMRNFCAKAEVQA